MMSFIKTTLLLLFLLCITKSIQGETVETTEKLITSNTTDAIESKANISESSTVKSSDKLENSTTNNVVETTTVSGEKGEEKSVPSDGKKRGEEKKRKHTLRRRRRSRIDGLKKKYAKLKSLERSDSGSSDTDKDNANSNSGVSDSPMAKGMDGDNIDLTESNQEVFDFLKKFLDKSCVVLKSYSDFQNAVEDILAQTEKINVNLPINQAAILSYLSNFKEEWEKYCDGPKETVEALEFFRDFLYKTSKLFESTTVQADTATDKDLSNISDDAKRRYSPKLRVSDFIKGLSYRNDKTRAEAESVKGATDPIVTTLEKFVRRLDLPPPTKDLTLSLLETLHGPDSAKRSESFLAVLTNFINVSHNIVRNLKALMTGGFEGISSKKTSVGSEQPSTGSEQPSTGSEQPSTGSEEPSTGTEKPSTGSETTESSKRSEFAAPTLENVLQKYCELSRGSSDVITTLEEVVKDLNVSDKRYASRRTDDEVEKFLNSLKALFNINSGASKRFGYEKVFVKEIMEKYCNSAKRSNSALISEKTVKRPIRPEVRTKSNKPDSVSRKQRSERSEYDDVIGWRHDGFEPSNRQTEKSSPRIFKKTKIKTIKKPKNLKNRIIKLYNEKEGGTRTRSRTGQFSKVKIIGHKENPSTSFEVKTGVERDTGSNDSNPRLRCKVRTQGSMSDAEGRTGSSKGHTFSEIPSNDTKALLCSSETSEVHRPNQDVYIKQSVSGKSIVSYDTPDKYIRNNYSPSKENLEIGTSGFSTLKDTSSKNQSISVVSTDSQSADSISRSETKFVQENVGSQRGMESSANVEGSIDAVPNKNPFITNSRQHSLGMVVENPDKNMESPLPVENNEKLQTYSKFQRTEDFDITFRRLDPKRSRPGNHHRRRPRRRRLELPTELFR